MIPEIVIICIVVLVIYRSISLETKKFRILNKYKNYDELMNYSCNVAFDTVYKDQLMTFHLNGYSVPIEILETSQRNYVKLVFQLLGGMKVILLTEYFTTEECMISNLIYFFNSKVEETSIIKTRLQDTVNG